MKRVNGCLKRVFDLVFALLGLVVLLPLFLLIALAIRLDSKGPVLFLQGRLGKDGRVFRICKFRSMCDKAEFIGTGLFNYADDPRVTKVGGFLRKTSLDELPQLWNIMVGDMSFVGPRPPVTYELGDYEAFDADLKRCFSVKPGVTGLAQINGRNELSRDEKTVFDLAYIDGFSKWGLLLDARIMLVTVFKVLTMEGSHERPENHAADAAKMNKKSDA